MKKSLISIILMFVVIIILNSCSDSSTSTKTTVNPTFLPTTVGSYWITETQATDTNGVIGSVTTDSTVYADTATKESKLASVFNDYAFNSNKYEYSSTSYFNETNTEIWTYSNYIESLLNIGLTGTTIIPNQWIKLIDKANSSWDIMSIPVDTIQIPTTTYSIFGTIKVTGSKGGTETKTVNSVALNCQVYNINVTFDGNVLIKPYAVPVSFTRPVHILLAEKVGLVSIVCEPVAINVSSVYSEELNGFQQNLIRYVIK